MYSEERAVPTVLIIDPDPTTAVDFENVVRGLGLSAKALRKGAEAVQRFAQNPPALVVLDLALPDLPALQVLEQFAGSSRVPVIAMADGASLRSAVQAMRAGASDVIDKRCGVDELVRAIKSLLPLTSGEIAPHRGTAGPHEGLFQRSEKMRALEPTVARLAAVSIPVLIRGEAGVGKNGVATAIHYLSPRASAPFIKVACSALPADVLEARLANLVRTADGGTLFLDHVGDLPAAAQMELARLLDTGGGGARVLASTSSDMYALVASGRFRGDLYERLAVATIDVPPLRERPEEIVPLVGGFLERFAQEFHRPAPALTPDMATALGSYQWPGNVRELEHVVKRWVVLGTPEQIRRDLEERAAVAARSRSGNGLTLGLRDIARGAAREAERVALMAALQRAKGNRAAVARQLKVSYKTLLQKLSDTGITATARGRRRA
jgi:DNA-binding NtrC family response regulator